jgi:hypothetical protein
MTCRLFFCILSPKLTNPESEFLQRQALKNDMVGELGVVSGFLDEFRFQFHRSETINLAVDIMVAIDEPDVLHLRATL